MLQTALAGRKVTIQRRKVKTPHISSTTAIADGGRRFEPTGSDGPLQEGKPPPEEAIGGESDHAEGVAGAELEDAGDDLGDAAIGESQWDDDGDRFVRQEACVDGAEDDSCEAEAGESEWGGICDGFVGGLVLDDLGGCHGGWFCSWNDGFVRCGSSYPLNRSIVSP